MKIYTIAALVIIFSSIAFAADVQLPEGWQTPIEKEIPYKHSHGKNGKYLSVDADFNGDGQIDSAKLLIKSPGPGMGLIVFIKNQGKYICHILVELDETKWIKMMGIKAVEPGTYKTVCGKGYFECDKDEPDEITLKYTGVDFFLSEGANSYYYWNDVTKTFKGAQISD